MPILLKSFLFTVGLFVVLAAAIAAAIGIIANKALLIPAMVGAAFALIWFFAHLGMKSAICNRESL
jgi:hypothetical protein